MPRTSPWFEMPNPFEADGSRVLLLEPPGASAGELRARLLDETYGRPYVVDDGEHRCLHFSGRLIQSAMRLAAPNDLELLYTQAMMSFLLFRSRPRHIVQIGLGGGSLLKFCQTRLPATPLTVLENNPDVIALREAFLLPPDGPTLQVCEADGAGHLAQMQEAFDVLLVDAFDSTGVAASLATREFFEHAWNRLAGSGVMVVNLAGDEQSYAGLIGLAMEIFADQVIVFAVDDGDNTILLAFRDRDFEPNWRRLAGLARELRAKYGLPFPDFLAKIQRSAKRGLARQKAGGDLGWW